MKNINVDGMVAYLTRIDWQHILSVCLTPDDLWSAFKNVLLLGIESYVPTYTNQSISTSQRKVKRYPPGIKRSIARKRCLWRQHKKHPHDNNIKAAYNKIADKCRQLISKYELKTEERVISDNNVGSFYKFVNKRLSCKQGVSVLKKINGEIITDDAERADLLNEYFSSVCVNDNGLLPPIHRRVPDDTFIENITFTSRKVLQAIKN